MYGPELSLRFNRVVDGKALVFHYATTGDLVGMTQLFQQGRASPSDVRFDSGWTPLHVGHAHSGVLGKRPETQLTAVEQYAIQNNQVDVCKLLLQAGGDPNVETEAPS